MNLKQIPHHTIILKYETYISQSGVWKIPVIEVFVCNDYQVCFYCEFCRKFHYHGRGGHNGNGDGHRSAHCFSSESPFDKTGYILLNQEQTTLTYSKSQDITKQMEKKR